jgi:hypothetical protein
MHIVHKKSAPNGRLQMRSRTMEKKFASLKEKIAAEKAERAAKHESFAALYRKAQSVGFQAGETTTPRPMGIVECDAMGRPIGPTHVEYEGMCGFASVIVRHANKGFGHWLISSGLARRHYHGGAEIWIHAHNQSYERKVAHADAMARLFNEAGFECHASGRLD